ncbi:MAG TPA: hypothetical protein DDY78_20005 [Planctomycetales bacterium]|jgi:hypothetical protein|nr:hypothetical protein [Planctomycetales bacterium]
MSVIDLRTRTLLQQTFRRESLSLLRYIGEAFPWTVAAGDGALKRVSEIVAEDRGATEALGRFLFRRRIPPSFSGAYPSGFTTLNFLSLEYLLPRLVDTQRKALAELESDAAAVTDIDAKTELEKLLAVKRLHLTELEALKVPRGESTKV